MMHDMSHVVLGLKSGGIVFADGLMPTWHQDIRNNYDNIGGSVLIVLAWIDFDTSMDEKLHPLQSAGWNCLSPGVPY